MYIWFVFNLGIPFVYLFIFFSPPAHKAHPTTGWKAGPHEFAQMLFVVHHYFHCILTVHLCKVWKLFIKSPKCIEDIVDFILYHVDVY